MPLLYVKKTDFVKTTAIVFDRDAARSQRCWRPVPGSAPGFQKCEMDHITSISSCETGGLEAR